MKKSIIKVIRQPQLAELADEKVMIDFESGKYFLLKGSAKDIWELIYDGVSVDEIIQNLLKEYDISSQECEENVEEFLKQLEKFGFIQLKD